MDLITPQTVQDTKAMQAPVGSFKTRQCDLKHPLLWVSRLGKQYSEIHPQLTLGGHRLEKTHPAYLSMGIRLHRIGIFLILWSVFSQCIQTFSQTELLFSTSNALL